MSKPKTAELARGRWPGILKAMGIGEEFLRDRHGPCPVCAGKDRFRFDDKEGAGTYFCPTCGPGDGFRLLMNFTGKGFADVAREVEKLCHLPIVEQRSEQDSEQKREWCRKTWAETMDITPDDAAGRYLTKRLGLADYPKALRFHPMLWHKDAGKAFPGLVCRIINGDGEVVGLHRTFLDGEGGKAKLEKAKMAYVWKRQEGSALRLGASDSIMGITEGLETAIAAQKRFSVPCWAAISAIGMFNWIPPHNTKTVYVFGDNDASFTGQAAAYGLASRLKKRGLAVEVRIPEQQGKDWADE